MKTQEMASQEKENLQAAFAANDLANVVWYEPLDESREIFKEVLELQKRLQKMYTEFNEKKWDYPVLSVFGFESLSDYQDYTDHTNPDGWYLADPGFRNLLMMFNRENKEDWDNFYDLLEEKLSLYGDYDYLNELVGDEDIWSEIDQFTDEELKTYNLTRHRYERIKKDWLEFENYVDAMSAIDSIIWKIVDKMEGIADDYLPSSEDEEVC